MKRTTTFSLFTVAAALVLASFAPAQDSSVRATADQDQVQASVLSLGKGVSAKGAAGPGLYSTLPVVGSKVTMILARLTPASSGMLYMGPRTTTPAKLSNGGVFYLDLYQFKNWAAVPYAASESGFWSWQYTVPDSPELAGLTLTFQTLGFPSGQVEVSNALVCTVGY